MVKFLKKYHKWLGIVLSLFILFFSISGIVLNHRELFAGFDISRSWMPQEDQYHNWDNAAVKGTLKVDSSSVLIYGNIGIWKTDIHFQQFSDFTQGIPSGIDNRKICKLFKDHNGKLFAGTFFGLYQYDFEKENWEKIDIPVYNKRITDIFEKDNSLYVLTRDYLLQKKEKNDFTILELPEPENYTNKIGLFKTLWVIHSGEIYGTIGKLIVDLIGIIFIFLTITGLILFINPRRLKSLRKKDEKIKAIQRSQKWNLKWHNKLGWTTIVLLLITTITGMFLRPPLLIPIANKQVEKIPFTHLDSPNPWNDKLRRILYDEAKDRFIVATLDGFYYSDDNFQSKLKRFKVQPPASVMGVNVFDIVKENTYLVGSFEGLFLWNPVEGSTLDYIENKNYEKSSERGSPIGNYLTTGISYDFEGKETIFTYNLGAFVKGQKNGFVAMPEAIADSPISLWNVALEVHTARIYKPIIGMFYLLIIPLSGILMIFILISGFVVWFKKYRSK